MDIFLMVYDESAKELLRSKNISENVYCKKFFVSGFTIYEK